VRRAPALALRAFRRGGAAQRHRWEPDRPGWPGRGAAGGRSITCPAGPPAGAASHVTPGLLALSLTCGLPVGGLGPERTGTAADSAAESESGGPPRPPAGGHFDGAPTLRGSGDALPPPGPGARAQPAVCAAARGPAWHWHPARRPALSPSHLQGCQCRAPASASGRMLATNTASAAAISRCI
jgi:hypothetical protein